MLSRVTHAALGIPDPLANAHSLELRDRGQDGQHHRAGAVARHIAT
jgi:hypothetical protein